MSVTLGLECKSGNRATRLMASLVMSLVLGALFWASSASAASTPIITAISPNSGPAAGGYQVALSGLDFADVSAVSFGGAHAPILLASNTQVTVIAPAGSGAIPVTVTTPGGTSNAAMFTYNAPVITSISLGTGAVGDQVTLSGMNFLNVTTVSFGGTEAPIVSATDTQIVVIVPAVTGAVSVTITTPSGTSNALTFTIEVTVQSLTDMIEELITDQGQVNALTSTLQAAQSALERGNTRAAQNQIKAFMNQVKAQSGKKIPQADADLLLLWAGQL